MTDYTLKDPLWLLALLLIPLVLWLRGRRSVPVLLVPFAAAWHRPSLTAPSRWPAVIALVGVGLLIVALARPQKVEDKREVRSQGYDIMLAIDLSGSMLSEDFERNGERINRLQAIRPIIQAFINLRRNDRIGLVVFSGRAYTLAPLTFDHDWLAKQVERLKLGVIEDGTAIGDGLGVSLTRLEQAGRTDGQHRKGAFIVLMTDGANNRGAMQPMQAAELAKSRDIPVYMIGAGKDGLVPFPVTDDRGNRIGTRRIMSDLDETMMRDVAALTGAQYFRADAVGTAEAAFRAIDRAQKIEFQAKSYLLATELFHWFAAPGLACILLAGLFGRGGRLFNPTLRKPAASPVAAAPPPLPGTRPALSPQ